MQKSGLVVAALLFLSASAQAQTISPESPVQYLNLGDDFYLNAGILETGGSGNAGIVSPPGEDAHNQEFTIAMSPAFEGVTQLDGSATLHISAHFESSASLQGLVPLLLSGHFFVSCTLEIGGETIATCSEQEGTLIPGESFTATWDVQPDLTTLDASAGNIEWTVNTRGVGSGALFTANENGDSRIEFPVLSGGSGDDDGNGITGPIIRNLTSETVAISQSFSNEPTNDTYEFHWQGNLSDVLVEYGATVEQGNATLTIIDGGNMTLLEADIMEDFASNETFTDTTTGNWTIRIDYEEFMGDMAVSINPVEEGTDGGADGSDDGADGDVTDGTDGNATDDTDGNATGDDDEEESPGFTVAAIGAALFAVVAVMRRRRT